MNEEHPQDAVGERERQRSEGRTASRRNQILMAAATCFHARGFHGASMAELAREAGMSVGHIYHYFENKEAIIEAIVDRDLERFLGILDKLAHTERLADALLEAIRDSLSQSCSRQRTLLRLEVLAEASRSPRVAAKVRAMDGAMRTRHLELLRNLDTLKDLGEPELVARADTMVALLEGLTLRALRHPEMDVDATIESARPLVRALLEDDRPRPVAPGKNA